MRFNSTLLKCIPQCSIHNRPSFVQVRACWILDLGSWIDNERPRRRVCSSWGGYVLGHYGDAMGRVRKASVLSAHTVDSAKQFHSGMERAKKEFLYCSVLGSKCLYLYRCFARVRLSAGVRMPSTGISTLPWTILYNKASRASRRLWANGGHLSWFKMAVTLAMWSYAAWWNGRPSSGPSPVY